MKCKCCGQETQARIATPTDLSRSDWIGQDVSYCEYCGEFIYKLDEDQPSVEVPGLLPIFLAATLSGFAHAPNYSFESVLLPDPPDPPQPWHLFAGCVAQTPAPTAA